MKKVYSLGLHKTGSTALQMFLQRNQLALLGTGTLFPPVTPHGVSRLLAEAAGRKAPEAPYRLNEYMGHNALAYQMIAEALPDCPLPGVHRPMFAGGMALTVIEDLAVQCAAETLLFCSEDLARAAFLAGSVPERFANRFGAEDTTLMMTVRRPDEAISSWQSQLLRFGGPVPALTTDIVRSYFNTIHVNYSAALAPWVQAFPNGQLVLADYASVRVHGGSVAFFCNSCGLSLPDDLVEPGERNSSLHPALFEVARRATHDLSRRDAVVLRDFLFSVQHDLDLPEAGEVDMLGPEARTELATFFEPVHATLSDFAGRETFFTDADRISEPPPITHIDAAKAALPQLLEVGANAKPAVREYLQQLSASGLARS